MADETETEDGHASSDPLTWVQRTITYLAGVSSLAAGATSVFLTTNQAGSVALIAVGAIFLTVAVTGAPLLGAKFKDLELRMATVRRKVVEIAQNDEPEQAIRALDILSLLDPASRNDPDVRAAYAGLYEAEVETALTRVLFGKVEGSGFPGHGADLLINLKGGKRFYVMMKSTIKDPATTFLFFKNPRRILETAKELKDPFLLVTNMRITKILSALVKEYGATQVQVVQWRGPEDDSSLAKALDRLGIEPSEFTGVR